MSRTYRRGRPGHNLHYYQHIGVVYPERQTYYFGDYSWESEVKYLCRGNEGHLSYDEYARLTILQHHRDGLHCALLGNVPSWCRLLDVKRQSRQHKALIHRGLTLGDYDIALTALDKGQSYNYW
ncbi:hypothetical protein HNP46_006512 [Pseudomonas nitritireducens]|uniref:Uncharacterized protein n=1 Tax=Pseudomonas nitroreducens TaxID=46680 RepID=A0A7W7KSA8_PSENT|nr:hypothetical protein [Pseudomonas nitritireducens]MBB4867598.1 hypothetical protein [Pseudomonas nitritireducens]